MVGQPTTGRADGPTGLRFVVLRLLRHNELGMFRSYRRLGKEHGVNFDLEVCDRAIPAFKDTDSDYINLLDQTVNGPRVPKQQLKLGG